MGENSHISVEFDNVGILRLFAFVTFLATWFSYLAWVKLKDGKNLNKSSVHCEVCFW